MRANLTFLQEKFREYNDLCFGGELPPLRLRISDSGRALGTFRHPRIRRGRSAAECSISLSSRYDLPQATVEDTLIHEMIHYFIWHRGIIDSSPHGPAFRRIMTEINRRHGRNLSVNHRSSAAQLDSDTRRTNHYICLLSFRDGRRSAAFPARTRILELHRFFSRHPEIASLKWFWSSDPFFNRFAVCTSPKHYLLTAEMERHIAAATPCVCDGESFRPLPPASRK